VALRRPEAAPAGSRAGRGQRAVRHHVPSVRACARAHDRRRSPEPGEAGRKDTAIAYPGEITRVRALFDRRGLFVWHCHLLEHEDHEMMRPFRVG